MDYQNKTIFEIGCVNSGFTFYLFKNDVKYLYAVDVDDIRIGAAKELISENYNGNNYEFSNQGAGNTKQIPDQSVDAIISDAVFEHIYHRDEMFQEVKRILKPGGKLLFTTSPIWKT